MIEYLIKNKKHCFIVSNKLNTFIETNSKRYPFKKRIDYSTNILLSLTFFSCFFYELFTETMQEGYTLSVFFSSCFIFMIKYIFFHSSKPVKKYNHKSKVFQKIYLYCKESNYCFSNIEEDIDNFIETLSEEEKNYIENSTSTLNMDWIDVKKLYRYVKKNQNIKDIDFLLSLIKRIEKYAGGSRLKILSNTKNEILSKNLNNNNIINKNSENIIINKI